MKAYQSKAANVGLILLAAGASVRLGKPKQLLLYKGKTLLQHSLQTAQESYLHPLVVVLGAEAERLQSVITDVSIHVVVNTGWKEGMASSIRCGIKALQAICPEAEGVILMVCDQPFVTATLLHELIAAHQQTSKPVVACGYGNTFGPPVFFHQTLFKELLQLKGDVGARSIVKMHADAVVVLPFEKGTIDVDIDADYEKIKKEETKK